MNISFPEIQPEFNLLVNPSKQEPSNEYTLDILLRGQLRMDIFFVENPIALLVDLISTSYAVFQIAKPYESLQNKDAVICLSTAYLAFRLIKYFSAKYIHRQIENKEYDRDSARNKHPYFILLENIEFLSIAIFSLYHLSGLDAVDSSILLSDILWQKWKYNIYSLICGGSIYFLATNILHNSLTTKPQQNL